MKKTKGELEYIEVSNSQSSIKICLQGAHIFDFRVKGKDPLLFLSETARFEKGFPIRGGIPICWPWFGEHPSDNSLPNHGFARISLWEHISTQDISEAKSKIIMSLKSSKQSLEIWPFEFELRLEILMSDTLELSLISTNTGDNDFTLSQALHTYLHIQDIHKTKVLGLENKRFYNKLDNTYDNKEETILNFGAEIDRIYQDLDKPLLLKDTHQDIIVQTEGSHTLVLWNPGPDFKKSFSDLSEYKTMLCLESANALNDKVTLHSNETHILKNLFFQTTIASD